MEPVVLKATVRSQDQSAKKMRKVGFIPAELYGQGKTNVHLQVNAIDFEKAHRKAGESTIVTLDIDGVGQRSVLIHDVQANFLKGFADHVDFYEVNMSETLTATVQLEFVGEPLAVKALGGTLVKVISEVEVECLPKDLPHSIEVNIESLKTFDDQISLQDIKLPSGVSLTAEDLKELVVKVQPPRDVDAELAEPVTEDISKVEGAVEAPTEEKSEAGKE